MKDQTEFHWAEGMKYAMECIKTLFLLNGAATVSILTFIGNTRSKPDYFVWAMGCFAVGAATGPLALGLSYLAQLKYGNSTIYSHNSGGQRSAAVRFHHSVYWVVPAGVVLFLLGVALAGVGMWNLPHAMSNNETLS